MSILPLLSESNMRNAVLRYSSFKYVYLLIVAAKNSAIRQHSNSLTRVVDGAALVGVCTVEDFDKLF
jgi:hypothetical protein